MELQTRTRIKESESEVLAAERRYLQTQIAEFSERVLDFNRARSGERIRLQATSMERRARGKATGP